MAVGRLLGIVGGIAPESTVDYYRRIIALYRERRPDGSYPAIIINSIDLMTMFGTRPFRRFPFSIPRAFTSRAS